MAYDEGLAERVRELLSDEPGVAEKRMFGGLAFLRGGNMCVGVVGEDLMVRVKPDAYAGLLRLPHVRKMDFTGRPMKGFVFVSADGSREDPDLQRWVDEGLVFVRSLSPKEVRPSAKR